MTEATSPGRIMIDLFTTLDGVGQAPGAPDEDTSGGFRFGGWQAPFPDPAVGESVMAGIRSMDALMLGRRTYEIFARYWPHRLESEIGAIFDRVPRYVATRNPGTELAWRGSTRIGASLTDDMHALRERHQEIRVIGSIGLVQTLLAERLFDELRLWVYPVVLGEGRKVFPDGAAPANLRLLEAPTTADCGAVLLRYAPKRGLPATGDMSETVR